MAQRHSQGGRVSTRVSLYICYKVYLNFIIYKICDRAYENQPCKCKKIANFSVFALS